MTETFEQWELSARMALGDQGVGYHAATPLIEDARAHCAATGQDPREAFGSPEEFAAAAAEEQPAEVRAEVDRHGLTVADHLTGQLLHLAVLLLVISVLTAVLERTLSIPVTPAGLTGLALLTLALVAGGGLPGALRAAGRPHQVRYAFLGTGVLGLSAATAFTTLPREHLGRVPVLVLVALSVAAIALLTRPASGPPAHPEPADREAWLERLRGVLVGRHDLPPGRADDLVREARAHLDATGAAPREEFGPLADYARRLAEPERDRRDPWWRTPPATMLYLVLGIAVGVDVLVGWWADGHRWAAWLVAAPIIAAQLWMLISTGRDYRRKR
jgi:hypothetical protein